MAFKVQKAFQYGGVAQSNDKYVSGKREAYYISQIGAVGLPISGGVDLTTGSVPSGWSHNTSSHSTTSQFTDTTAGDYFLIKGDAVNNSYPLRYATAFQGDYLFQLSFYASNNPTGADWGMCVSDTTYTDRSTGTEWYWTWSLHSSRIAVQQDLNAGVKLYGTSSSAGTQTGSNYNVEATAGYKTMHFQHRPSTGVTKLKVTDGSNDWTASNTQLGSTVQISETIVSDSSTDYWFGIGADNDNTSFAKADYVRFTSSTTEFF
tara:strand:+ start:30 stop:815 length:786 start_codon:yes stop_codon:yes gene_type:complete